MVVNRGREEWKIEHGVFDQFTLRVLEKLRAKELFDEIKGPIAMGKEANVFSTFAERPTVIKIYRLENRDFTGMLRYIVQDPRYLGIKKRKREIVFAWTQREYRNILLAREAMPVPKPIAHMKNVILMEQIGHPDPAPQLKDALPKDPEKFYQRVVGYVKKLRKHGLIHGDLSEFNILNHNEQPIFIDFSQSTPVESPNAQELWERDVKNLIRAAKKVDVKLTKEDFEQD